MSLWQTLCFRKLNSGQKIAGRRVGIDVGKKQIEKQERRQTQLSSVKEATNDNTHNEEVLVSTAITKPTTTKSNHLFLSGTYSLQRLHYLSLQTKLTQGVHKTKTEVHCVKNFEANKNITEKKKKNKIK